MSNVVDPFDVFCERQDAARMAKFERAIYNGVAARGNDRFVRKCRAFLKKNQHLTPSQIYRLSRPMYVRNNGHDSGEDEYHARYGESFFTYMTGLDAADFAGGMP